MEVRSASRSGDRVAEDAGVAASELFNCSRKMHRNIRRVDVEYRMVAGIVAHTEVSV